VPDGDPPPDRGQQLRTRLSPFGAQVAANGLGTLIAAGIIYLGGVAAGLFAANPVPIAITVGWILLNVSAAFLGLPSFVLRAMNPRSARAPVKRRRDGARDCRPLDPVRHSDPSRLSRTVRSMLERVPSWLLGCLLLVVGQTAPWVTWATGQSGTSLFEIAGNVCSVVVALAFAIVFVPRVPIRFALVFALNAVGALVGTFASAYVSYGTTRDWSSHLSRLDALMVSLGNFSTAGTAGITPRSELARALITSQYALDLVAGVVVVGLLVARLASPRP